LYPTKFTQIGIFGLKINHLANLGKIVNEEAEKVVFFGRPYFTLIALLCKKVEKKKKSLKSC
jgi:hypothetical protein